MAEAFVLLVVKINCLEAPTEIDGAAILAGALPDGCQVASGVAFDVQTTGGTNLESPEAPFITDEHGTFGIALTESVSLVISEDVTTATPGYAPLQNPVTVLDVTANADPVVFVNVLEQPAASPTATATSTPTETPAPTETPSPTATVTPTSEATLTPTPPFGDQFALPVFKLDCLHDPGQVSGLAVSEGELPEGCSLASGVAFDVTVNGSDIEDPQAPFVTGEHGAFVIAVRAGDDLVITEDTETATSGFLPRENPLLVPDVSPETEPVVFVNLAATGDVAIVKRVCTVSEERDTTIRVRTGTALAVDDACSAGSGVNFTIAGDALSNPVYLTTGLDGTAIAALPPGDYTIMEEQTGAEASFTVHTGEQITILVTNYQVKEPSEPAEEVDTLPSTGTGTSPGTTGAIVLLLSVLVLGATLANRWRALRRG